MYRRSLVVILLAAVVVLAAFGFGVWKLHKPAERKTDGIPSVDAEIDAVWPSPDFSRIVLALRRKTTDPNLVFDYGMAIFDPAKKRITAELPNYPSDTYGGRPAWSPDSEWIAVRGNDRNLLLVDRDGGRKRILNPGGKRPNIGYYAWRPSPPNRLVYALYGVPSELREYNVETSTDRLIFKEVHFCHTIEGLFNVKGNMCAAYLMPNAAWRSYNRVFVEKIDTHRRILELPLNGMSFDGMDFDMSPDGEMFVFRWGESLYGDMIVGNTKDVATTWTHPWRQIMGDGGHDLSPKPMITWRPPHHGTSTPSSWTAIMNSTKGYLLFYSRGGWDVLRMLPERPASFSWWEDNTYLAIDKDGLWITNNGRNLVHKGVSLPDPYREKLILRHKPAGR